MPTRYTDTQLKGFTLIELTVALAIIAILAMIAFPLYQGYLQRSANEACLYEASAYITSAATDLAAQRPAPAYTRSACAGGPSAHPTTAHYNADLSITFTPPVRGTPSLHRDVVCQIGTRPCRLRQ